MINEWPPALQLWETAPAKDSNAKSRLTKGEPRVVVVGGRGGIRGNPMKLGRLEGFQVRALASMWSSV